MRPLSRRPYIQLRTASPPRGPLSEREDLDIARYVAMIQSSPNGKATMGNVKLTEVVDT